MSNRILLGLCLFGTVFSLAAQIPGQGKKTDKQAGNVPVRKSEMQALRFDPNKPTLTVSYVEQCLNSLNKNLFTRELPESLDKIKTMEDMFSNLAYRSVVNSYHMLANHFELYEVTKVAPVWYRNLDQQIKAFEMIVRRLNLAILNKDSQAYATSLDAFKKQQAACLAFLKKKQPKIGSGQLMKIRNANIRRRRAEYNARIKKEREEQLKKLQEEKSQKNTNK